VYETGKFPTQISWNSQLTIQHLDNLLASSGPRDRKQKHERRVLTANAADQVGSLPHAFSALPQVKPPIHNFQIIFWAVLENPVVILYLATGRHQIRCKYLHMKQNFSLSTRSRYQLTDFRHFYEKTSRVALRQ
jgi:hypothetical protein